MGGKSGGVMIGMPAFIGMGQYRRRAFASHPLKNLPRQTGEIEKGFLVGHTECSGSHAIGLARNQCRGKLVLPGCGIIS